MSILQYMKKNLPGTLVSLHQKQREVTLYKCPTIKTSLRQPLSPKHVGNLTFESSVLRL